MTAAASAVTWCNPFTSTSCLEKALYDASPLGAAKAITKATGSAVGTVAGHAVGAATTSAIDQLAQAIGQGITQLLTDLFTLWMGVKSPDLTADPVPRIMQEYLWPWTVAVALIGFITVSARMALTRKGAPLADLGQGVLVMACTTAAGTILPTLLLQAGDEWSNWVLQASSGGQFKERFGHLFGSLTITSPGVTAGIIIVVGIVFMILTMVQALLLLFRLGSVVILAGVLPLAAVGTLNPLMKPGFKRICGWLLALIFYKPAAAMVLSVGFLMFGDGKSITDIFTGLAVMVLSVVALPVLMKFFTWATGELQTSGGSMLGTVMGAATAFGSMRGGGGSSASGQASTVNNGLGKADNGNPPPPGNRPDGSKQPSGPSPDGGPGGKAPGGGQQGSAPGAKPSAGNPGAMSNPVVAGGTIALGTAQAGTEAARGFAGSSGPPKETA